MLWAGGLVIEIVVSSDRHETLLGRRKCPPHLMALELVRPHTWICPQILTETDVSTRRSCWVLLGVKTHKRTAREANMGRGESNMMRMTTLLYFLLGLDS